MNINKEEYELLVAQVEPGLELVGLIGYLERKGLDTWAASEAALELYEKHGTLADLEKEERMP